MCCIMNGVNEISDLCKVMELSPKNNELSV